MQTLNSVSELVTLPLNICGACVEFSAQTLSSLICGFHSDLCVKYGGLSCDA
jgi:hypothetical protein